MKTSTPLISKNIVFRDNNTSINIEKEIKKGIDLKSLKKYKKAKLVFKDCLSQNRKSNYLVNYQLGSILEKEFDYKVSNEYLIESLKSFKNSPKFVELDVLEKVKEKKYKIKCYYKIIKNYYHLNRFDKFMSTFEIFKSLIINVNTIKVQLMLADIYSIISNYYLYFENNINEALKYVGKACEITSNNLSLKRFSEIDIIVSINAIFLLFKKRLFDEGNELLKVVEKKYSSYSYFHFIKAKVNELKEDYEESIKDLTRGIKKNNLTHYHLSLYYSKRGYYYSKIKMMDRAKEELEKAKKMINERDYFSTQLYYIDYFSVFLQEFQYVNNEDTRKRSVEKLYKKFLFCINNYLESGLNVRIKNLYGLFICKYLKDYEKGLKIFNSIIKNFPKNSYFLLNRANLMIQFLKSEKEKAAASGIGVVKNNKNSNVNKMSIISDISESIFYNPFSYQNELMVYSFNPNKDEKVKLLKGLMKKYPYKDTRFLSKIYYLYASIHQQSGEKEISEQYLKKVLSILINKSKFWGADDYKMLALCYYHLQNIKEAEKYFKLSLNYNRFDKSFIQAFLNLKIQQNKYEEAIILIDDFKGSNETKIDFYLNLGRVLYDDKEYKQGIKVLSKCLTLKTNYKNDFVLNLRGACYVKIKVYKKGEADLVNVKKKCSKNLNNLGVLYYHEKKFSKALDNFLLALDFSNIENSNDTINDKIFALSNIAYTYKQLNGIKHYQSYLEKILEFKDYKKLDEVYYLLGKLFYEQKKYEKSIDMYEKALEISPKKIKILVGFGKVIEHEGIVKTAKIIFKKISEHEKATKEEKAHSFYILGNVASNEQNRQNCKYYYSKAIELMNENADYYIARANHYFECKNYEKAKTDYESCLKHDKTKKYKTFCVNAVATIAYSNGKFQKSIDLYRKHLEDSKDDKYFFLYMIGRGLRHLKKYDESISISLKSLSLRKTSDCYNSIGLCYIKKAKEETKKEEEIIDYYLQAIDYYNYAVSIEENEADKLCYINNIIQIYQYQLSKYDVSYYEDAKSELQKLLKIKAEYKYVCEIIEICIIQKNYDESLNWLFKCYTDEIKNSESFDSYNIEKKRKKIMENIENNLFIKFEKEEKEEINNLYYLSDKNLTQLYLYEEEEEKFFKKNDLHTHGMKKKDDEYFYFYFFKSSEIIKIDLILLYSIPYFNKLITQNPRITKLELLKEDMKSLKIIKKWFYCIDDKNLSIFNFLELKNLYFLLKKFQLYQLFNHFIVTEYTNISKYFDMGSSKQIKEYNRSKLNFAIDLFKKGEVGSLLFLKSLKELSIQFVKEEVKFFEENEDDKIAIESIILMLEQNINLSEHEYYKNKKNFIKTSLEFLKYNSSNLYKKLKKYNINNSNIIYVYSKENCINKIKCDKDILKIRSIYFKALLNFEKQNQIVQIDMDVDFKILKILIEFIYTKEFPTFEKYCKDFQRCRNFIEGYDEKFENIEKQIKKVEEDKKKREEKLNNKKINSKELKEIERRKDIEKKQFEVLNEEKKFLISTLKKSEKEYDEAQIMINNILEATNKFLLLEMEIKCKHYFIKEILENDIIKNRLRSYYY